MIQNHEVVPPKKSEVVSLMSLTITVRTTKVKILLSRKMFGDMDRNGHSDHLVGTNPEGQLLFS